MSASSSSSVADADATPKRKEYKPSGYIPISEQKERKAQRLKMLRLKKKQRIAAEKQRKIQLQVDVENARSRSLADARWNDCLTCLRTSVPILKANPWLCILEPSFIHNYLDSLTETLANLSRHEQDMEMVRVVLQSVYEGFVELGRFAKYQPAFFISHPHTIKRFVRLLEQVAHRGSDKALFPNVLSLLGPTFERVELYDLLGDARVVHSLMSFVRTDWMPTPSTLSLLLSIIEQLSVSPRLRALIMEDLGYDKLQGLAMGIIQGFNKEQQQQATQALSLFPAPVRPEPPAAAADGSKDPSTAAANASTDSSATPTPAVAPPLAPAPTSTSISAQVPPSPSPVDVGEVKTLPTDDPDSTLTPTQSAL